MKTYILFLAGALFLAEFFAIPLLSSTLVMVGLFIGGALTIYFFGRDVKLDAILKASMLASLLVIATILWVAKVFQLHTPYPLHAIAMISFSAIFMMLHINTRLVSEQALVAAVGSAAGLAAIFMLANAGTITYLFGANV